MRIPYATNVRENFFIALILMMPIVLLSLQMIELNFYLIYGLKIHKVIELRYLNLFCDILFMFITAHRHERI
jgi:hypothetical protein